MSRRFSGTTALVYDEHPESLLLAEDREVRRQQERRHAAEGPLLLIASVSRVEGGLDRTSTVERIGAAIASWERAV